MKLHRPQQHFHFLSFYPFFKLDDTSLSVKENNLCGWWCEFLRNYSTSSYETLSLSYSSIRSWHTYTFCFLYYRANLAHDWLQLRLIGYIFSQVKSLQILHTAHDIEIYHNRHNSRINKQQSQTQPPSKFCVNQNCLFLY
jgi:hypothetical protein